MTTTTHRNAEIEVIADFDQAAATICWRPVGDDQWQATPYQVADARHDSAEALRMVDHWLES